MSSSILLLWLHWPSVSQSQNQKEQLCGEASRLHPEDGLQLKAHGKSGNPGSARRGRVSPKAAQGFGVCLCSRRTVTRRSPLPNAFTYIAKIYIHWQIPGIHTYLTTFKYSKIFHMSIRMLWKEYYQQRFQTQAKMQLKKKIFIIKRKKKVVSFSFISVFLFLSTVGETTLSPNPPKQWIGSFNTGYKKKKSVGCKEKKNRRVLLATSCQDWVAYFS